MRDCEKVDIRDLLPEHAAGLLAGAERARVEAHLASCEACRAELALLRAVRAARPVPHVTAADVSRIVAALPMPPRASAPSGPSAPPTPGIVSLDAHRARRESARRALPWRRMAAIAAVLVGAVGVGVFGRGSRGSSGDAPLDLGPETTLLAATPVESAPPRVVTNGGRTPRESLPATRRGEVTVAQTTDALGALGGIASGADEEELEALIAGLESLSGVPEVEAGEESTDEGAA